MEEFITELSNLLARKLPGAEAQYKMAPELRLEEENARFKNAAVLILLYKKADQIYTLLMKRPEYKGPHSNQISFPGGKFEKGDRDLHHTALRETQEETGIDISLIHVLGELSPLDIPVSKIEVLPVVGYYPGVPAFKPDPSEVQYLIEAPLSDFFKPDTKQEKIKTILCKLVRVPYYNIDGNQVWGATAMILSEFLEIVRKIHLKFPQ